MSTQRKMKQALTPLELEIMQVLWEIGPSTVSEVQPRLKAQLAYTTVQTMLNVLLRKNKVKRVQEGRAFRYRAAVSRERATGNANEYVSWLEKARSTDSKALAPRLLLARHYLQTNDANQARDVAVEAQTIQPEHPDVLNLLGQKVS